jgi:hypothetical protein
MGQEKEKDYISSKTLQKMKERTLSPVVDHSRLDHQLRLALKRDSSTGGKFVPIGDLKRLVTQKSVEHELSRIVYLPTKLLQHNWRSPIDIRIELPPAYEGARHGQATPVIEGNHTQSDMPCFRKIFAILLFMGRPRKIWSFVKERVSDADLPLQDGIFELRRRGKTQPPLKCLKKPNDISQFLMYQWWVLAPFFCELESGIVSHYKVSENQVLPFICWGNTGRQGGSAEVHKASIHPDHHGFGKKKACANC